MRRIWRQGGQLVDYHSIPVVYMPGPELNKYMEGWKRGRVEGGRGKKRKGERKERTKSPVNDRTINERLLLFF